MKLDFEEIAAVVRLIKEADFSDFSYQKGDMNVVVRRGGAASETLASPFDAAPAPAPAPRVAEVVKKPAVAGGAAPVKEAVESSAPATSEDEGGRIVNSPMLGTFYGAPKPGESAFVKVGDRVEEDSVLCIVEVMKLMNSVVAGCNGVITKIHVKDGDLVEYGQPLFTLRES